MGRYYADYVRAMDHYDAVLPGRVLRVVHEEALHPPAPPDPEHDLGSRQSLAALLSQVDERTGEIALATFVMGLSNDRVAEMLGVSVRTVGRARAAFEDVVRRHRSVEAS